MWYIVIAVIVLICIIAGTCSGLSMDRHIEESEAKRNDS
jgi:hypothetical protein